MAENKRLPSDQLQSIRMPADDLGSLTSSKRFNASDGPEQMSKRPCTLDSTREHFQPISPLLADATNTLDTRQTTTPYQYKPLNEAAQEIRLLTILPGCFSSEMRVCLHVESFASEESDWETDPGLEFGEDLRPDYQADLDIKFEALSYTWGSPLDPVDIFIGTSGSDVIKVTQNLARALPYLRFLDRPRTIWIDAICVNQQDLEERSSQVKRMADIYSKATQVVVWLGPDRGDTELAIDFCKNVSKNVIFDWDRQTMKLAPGCHEEHYADENEVLRWTLDEEVAVCDLLKRDWFTRLWIWQEVILAKSVIVTCGFNCLPWEHIRNLILYLWIKRKTAYILGNLYQNLHVLYNLCQGQGNNVFHRLVDWTRYTSCTDPRDRLFALFSLLCSSEKEVAVEPDYTKSTSQVFWEFTQRHITSSKTLVILKFVEMNEGAPETPSWVPDWSSKRCTEYCLEPFLSGGIGNACVAFEGSEVLRVSGRKVSDIKFVEEPFQLGQFRYEQMAAGGAKFIMEITRRFVENGGPSIKEVAQVLCGGRIATVHGLYSPSDEHLPILKDIEEDAESLSRLLTKGGVLPSHFLAACNGRRLFQSSDGRIGVAPKASRPGDVVVVWLSSRNPVVLRGLDNGHYLLVGEAYFQGAMWVETLLGPLPDNFEGAKKYSLGLRGYCPGYINHTSGVFHPAGDDPRLSMVPLPDAWRKKSHDFEDFVTLFINGETGEETEMDPRMSAAELIRRGVELEEFMLE